MKVVESKNEVLKLIGRTAGVRFFNKSYRDGLHATIVVREDGRYLAVVEDGLHFYANFAGASSDEAERNAIVCLSKAGTAIISDDSWPSGETVTVWTSPGFSSLEELRMKVEIGGDY